MPLKAGMVEADQNSLVAINISQEDNSESVVRKSYDLAKFFFGSGQEIT
jgi:hypothetical protein